mmetsp:Transcript_64408/g.172384  ORF Transcript_64408/g.172384 Transcript_64408/m.172384 type:complete len:101 (-) Transcript_64408:241-543(-)
MTRTLHLPNKSLCPNYNGNKLNPAHLHVQLCSLRYSAALMSSTSSISAQLCRNVESLYTATSDSTSARRFSLAAAPGPGWTAHSTAQQPSPTAKSASKTP